MKKNIIIIVIIISFVTIAIAGIRAKKITILPDKQIHGIVDVSTTTK